MAEGAQAIVLCEGTQDWVFILRMLLELGYERRKIRLSRNKYPANGYGSGEQHVRTQYPDEVKAFRSRAARTKIVLVIHTDADLLTVKERFDTLENALESNGIKRRGENEAIAVLLPKRNTETWIHFFLGGAVVDEETSYPKFHRESDAWTAATAFAKHVQRGTTPTGAPASLVTALVEVKRIL